MISIGARRQNIFPRTIEVTVSLSAISIIQFNSILCKYGTQHTITASHYQQSTLITAIFLLISHTSHYPNGTFESHCIGDYDFRLPFGQECYFVQFSYLFSVSRMPRSFYNSQSSCDHAEALIAQSLQNSSSLISIELSIHYVQ